MSFMYQFKHIFLIQKSMYLVNSYFFLINKNNNAEIKKNMFGLTIIQCENVLRKGLTIYFKHIAHSSVTVNLTWQYIIFVYQIL